MIRIVDIHQCYYINGTRRLRINTLHKNMGGHEPGEERRGDIGFRVFLRQLSELHFQIGTLSHISYDKKRESKTNKTELLKLLGARAVAKRKKKKKKRPVCHDFGKKT